MCVEYVVLGEWCVTVSDMVGYSDILFSTVTIEELSQAIQQFDAKEAASISELMHSLDVDGDGVISMSILPPPLSSM